MLGRRSNYNRYIRAVGWASTWALVLLLLQSAFWTPRIPIALKVLVALLFVLSAVRPATALVALAGLVPIGHLLTTRVWQAYPFSLSEALVLAFLAGYLWTRRTAWSEPAAPADQLLLAVRLFSTIVLASAAVQLAVVQVWTDAPIRYAVRFVDYLFREYLTTIPDIRPYVNGRAFVSIAALLFEGAALMVVARTLSRSNPRLGARLINAAVLAGGLVAVLGFYEPFALAASTDSSVLQVMQSQRWASPAIPSINSLGAYCIFIVFLSAGTAFSSRRAMFPGLAIAAVSLWAAVWLTQTRSAIVAGLAVASAVGVWMIANRFKLKSRWIVVCVVLTPIVISFWIVERNPLNILLTNVERTLRFRLLFAQTAWRMIEAHPLTGVGIGHYPISHPQFASPELLEVYGRNDAHNYFLWVGAELGVVALGVFLWLLVSALAPLVRHLQLVQDARALGLATGIAAFVITWTTGQPLSIPQIAYTFWIVVGVAAGTGPPALLSDRPHRGLMLHRLAAAVVALFVVTIPLRAHWAIANIDLTNARYDFFQSGRLDGREFRWAGPDLRFHVPSSVRGVDFAVAAAHRYTPYGVDIDISVDGQPVQRLRLPDRRFRDVHLDAPSRPVRFWRVDIHVEPLGVASDLRSRRRIAVGEITFDRDRQGKD